MRILLILLAFLIAILLLPGCVTVTAPDGTQTTRFDSESFARAIIVVAESKNSNVHVDK
jgi:uncharacterized protein YceK